MLDETLVLSNEVISITSDHTEQRFELSGDNCSFKLIGGRAVISYGETNLDFEIVIR